MPQPQPAPAKDQTATRDAPQWDAVAEALRNIVGRDHVVRDRETLKPYECDGLSMYRELPRLVVLPGNVEETRAVLRLCSERRIPVVGRGAGTGLSAGAMPHADGIVLSMARLNRVLDIDPESRTARLEPGVTNLAVSEAAAEHGLFYAPDPSSQIACTIGGNVAENSGGVHCLKYGLTVHNLLAVELLTADGETLTAGGGGLDTWGFDLLALVTGSEGLLGIVTEVTVRLLPIPESQQVVLAGFDDVQAAGDAVSRIIADGIIPAGLEMMDNAAIRAAEAFADAGYPTEAAALLLCEVDGTAAEVRSISRRLRHLLESTGASALRESRDEAERLLMWKGRKSAFPAVGRISPDYYCMDGTIPRGQIARVLAEMTAMAGRYGLRIANVFHAGDGNLHPLILFDANTEGEFEKAERLGAEILELCVRVGGCITGEHGVGVEKIRQLPLQFSDPEIEQFIRLKSAFDPEGLLNPGKGIPLLKHCQEYRALASAAPVTEPNPQ